MNKKSELDCYLFYMWNKWSYDESVILFGEALAPHIWGKWMQKCQSCGAEGAPSAIYAELDSDKRRKIVERAYAYYND